MSFKCFMQLQADIKSDLARQLSEVRTWDILTEGVRCISQKILSKAKTRCA